MSDQLFSTSIGPHGTLRARPATVRTQSPSPSRQRRTPDDLLSQLTPASAVEALQCPTGPLKKCLDRASALEQAFALKTAVASKTVHDWLEELSAWPWPSAGTATGFEMPLVERNVSEPEMNRDDREANPHSDTLYLGSLQADRVVRYEKRIEEIRRDMEDLTLDEIKNQVLHHHILPLSRPGTPFSDSGRSTASAFTFAKMEDLTAVVTSITVQTLPMLSKLSRLLHIWSLRLVVLRKVSPFLAKITDAEVALRSGWSAIELMSESSGPSTQPISQKDIDVMKNVLQQKVTRSGQDLDFMLDALEGMMDTLPDEWLERMEVVERDYAKWVTTAERQMREAEGLKLSVLDGLDKRADPTLSRPNLPIKDASPTKMPTSPGISDYEPLGEEDRESWAVRILAGRSREDIAEAMPHVSDLQNNAAQHVADSSHNSHQNGVLSEVNRNVAPQPANQPSKHDALLKPFEDDFEPSVLESVNEEEEEPELPPMYPQMRKGSGSSVATTILRGSSNSSPSYSDRGAFGEASVEEASVQSDSPHQPDPYEPFSSDAISPPSSPPLRYKLGPTTSVTLKKIPTIAPLPEVNNSPPRGLLGPPVVFDPDSSFDWDSQLGSPSTNNPIDDDHLQKQLRELLETIPAKIELKRRGINLNPPDIQLPSRPKPRHSETSRRPNSARSSRPDSRVTTPSYSRSGTPSFMLAPVRDTRPRSMSSQGIRLYHLSRSGEMPIKLFIRCVGEQNERVMVRVGGGWSDLGEYLRDYALHHGSRSKGESKVEVTDAVPNTNKRPGSSHSSRPSSAHDSPMTPLSVRKTRQDPGDDVVVKVPRTPLGKASTGRQNANTPGSETSVLSGASGHVDWDEEDSSLGLAGPKAAKRKDISAESRAWIESVKAKVRLASSERIATSVPSEQLKPSQPSLARAQKKTPENGFGELGKAGTTKRLFRKN